MSKNIEFENSGTEMPLKPKFEQKCNLFKTKKVIN